MNAKELHALADLLFGKKVPINSLWQEVADNFYPERADFTLSRSIGTDFASNLMTSYPVLCRRDLGNQFSTMLRPTAKEWFHPQIQFQKETDNDTQVFMDYVGKTQRKAMYDPITMFTRATKEGDHDFAAFGQCALSVEVNHNSKAGPHLLYRCWHLKDMCWQENESGQVGTVFRKWKPTAQVLNRLFDGKLHQKITTAAKGKEPFTEFEVMHMVVDAELYDDDANGKPYFSIWWDVQNQEVIEAKPIWNKYYIIPRWQTVSGSQYSYSPATVAGLPDARLIQAMTFTLLEAGEKATNPPLVATMDAIKSDVSIFAGGITWVDNEYDERLGEALRPIAQDFRGFNFGVQMNADARAMIKEAFFLNTLRMPERGPEMTAYEVGQRIQEYIRNALPIFEPMEMEYNSALCDLTFDLMWRNGAFGDPQSWPKTLRGASIDFTFESPLHDAIEQQKGHKLQDVSQMLAQAISLDPSAALLVNVKDALRDALEGMQTPAIWIRSKDDVTTLEKQQQQAQQAQQMLSSMETASNVAQNMATAQEKSGGIGRQGSNPVSPAQPQAAIGI